MDLTTAAQVLTRFIGETEDDYQMAENGQQLYDLYRRGSEAISCYHPNADLADLYYAFGEVSDATRASEWTGIKPWDDSFENAVQAAVHTYAAELTRVLNDYGFTGTVVADTLDDILEPKTLADH